MDRWLCLGEFEVGRWRYPEEDEEATGDMNLELTSLTLGRRVEGGGSGAGTGAVIPGVDWPVLVSIAIELMRKRKKEKGGRRDD